MGDNTENMQQFIHSDAQRSVSQLQQPDTVYESPLRPRTFADFTGQRALVDRLEVVVKAAQQRQEPAPHCLFYGPPGLGKTTLAHLVAHAMGAQLHIVSGPALDKPADLAGVLSHLNAGDVFFIDEIHRLTKSIEEYLYPAMDNFSLDVLIDSGTAARNIQVQLKPFTLIAATTKQGSIGAPLRSRFGLVDRLEFYSDEELVQVLVRAARILHMQVCPKSARLIAKRSRGTPRLANNLLRWVRDYTQIKHNGVITESVVDEALTMVEIDAAGLDRMARRLLHTVIQQFNGGPVGLNALAMSLGEESATLEEVYEPYLLQQGFLRRGPRGREATQKAYTHLQNFDQGAP